jgi:hypothetical protein
VAEALDPQALFGHRGGFDHITVSYCLSMVDDPEAAVSRQVLEKPAETVRPQYLSLRHLRLPCLFFPPKRPVP